VVAGGGVEEAVGVEALRTVKQHRLWSQYGPGRSSDIAVFRPLNISGEEKTLIASTARGFVGRKYGYLMIAAHFLDWLLLGVYLFRRLVPGDRYPICSWLVAHAFSKADRHFGVDPGQASPDDIWDFVTSEQEKYRIVRPLGPLAG